MNEHDLRNAFQEVMVASSPPPPMNPNTALDTARADRRRRRATWTGAGAAVAVVALTVGAVVIMGRSGSDQIQVAGPPAPTAQSSTGTSTSWPDGQTDRTARSGPRHQKGVDLLDALSSAVPTGMTAPKDVKPTNPDSAPVRSSQANFEDRDPNGREMWSYSASTPVARATEPTKYGRLYAEVHTAGNSLPTDPCGLSQRLWGLTGDCQITDVDGKKVATVVRPSGERKVFDQWVAYRHPDGTVVYLAQAKEFEDSGLTGMSQPPIPLQTLAKLATDPRFVLS